MHDRDADHLRTLSILYYVSAGLSVFGILALCEQSFEANRATIPAG